MDNLAIYVKRVFGIISEKGQNVLIYESEYLSREKIGGIAEL
jgi:hypothetical protein